MSAELDARARDARAFLRLVAFVSIVTSGMAAGLSRGEIESRPYIQAVTGDAAGLGLTEEVMQYGQAARDLHVRVVNGVTP